MCPIYYFRGWLSILKYQNIKIFFIGYLVSMATPSGQAYRRSGGAIGTGLPGEHGHPIRPGI
jgi:hypothetical protein